MFAFWAVLKDSFREAVDGFVIYVMLAFSFIMLLIILSISFTPVSPDAGFSQIVNSFGTAYSSRGSGEAVGIKFYRGLASQVLPISIKYNVKNVEKVGGDSGEFGQHAFILEVSSDNPTEQKDQEPAIKFDWFRTLVAAWADDEPKMIRTSLDKNMKPKVPKEGEKVEELGSIEIPFYSPAELDQISPQDMEAFLQNQFLIHAGLEDTTVTYRGAEGDFPKKHSFEIRARSGPGVTGWPHEVKILFTAFTLSRGTTLGSSIHFIEDFLINGIGSALTLLISVILTSFFIPNLMAKGSMDLLIAKPISRLSLLLFKYLGGLIFIFIMATINVGGVWLILAITAGNWDPRFLLVIPILTFTFAILYAFSTLVGVVTRNAIASMLLTIGLAFFLYVVGQAKSLLDIYNKSNPRDPAPRWVEYSVEALNTCLPRYKDLDKLTAKLLAESTLTVHEYRQRFDTLEYPSWASAIGVSVAFIVLMLALSYWRFATRDG